VSPFHGQLCAPCSLSNVGQQGGREEGEGGGVGGGGEGQGQGEGQGEGREGGERRERERGGEVPGLFEHSISHTDRILLG
jgi:hypothetical protein